MCLKEEQQIKARVRVNFGGLRFSIKYFLVHIDACCVAITATPDDGTRQGYRRRCLLCSVG